MRVAFPLASLAVAAATAAAAAAPPPCNISNVFGSHMVLQRDSVDTLVYGFAAPGDTVTLQVDGNALPPSKADASGVWRSALPKSMTVAGGPHAINAVCSDGSTGGSLTDVLFGDVFLCGGQSNMQFTTVSAFNGTEEVARAANYPNVRVFSVGQGTTSYTPLSELGSIMQPWSVASPASIGNGNWSYFSAVCWMFGRNIFDALGGTVPIGLVSDNWGGTRVQAWSTNATNALCNTSVTYGEEAGEDAALLHEAAEAFAEPLHAGPGPNNATVLYNAMIYPYVVGPMNLKGFTWFQAEQNAGQPAVYACAFPQMVQQWKRDFAPASGGAGPWFGFVIMEPWVTTADLASLRDAQLQAMAVPNVGYGAAVDIGDPTGPWGSVHPRAKQIPSARLTASALAQVYGMASVAWTGPTFASASGSSSSGGTMTVTVAVQGLRAGDSLVIHPLDDAAACPTALGVPPALCAWPAIQASTGQWVNATLSVAAGGTAVVFTAAAPQPGATPSRVSYGWGVWPVNTVYASYTIVTKYEEVGFPLLGFNESVAPATSSSA
jgi:sialate O-acetylesterase